jgi:hypothetical protein|tara:strand:+ start:10548 stop:11306 length:759 start_codon:yes stop_codon:yes gene_type:complete
MQEQIPNPEETILPYDVVTLPSQGLFYTNKKKTLKVTYLNASDENLLASPAVQQAGTLVESLLTKKILDKDIVVSDMPDCDKEAVLIFLRNTAFGSDYTVTLTDPKTKKEFETTLDLSVLKLKESNVVVDEKNEFEYLLEQSKKKIKLKFLSPADELYLQEIDKRYKNDPINPYMTKQLERMVTEIDGVRDPMTISQMIQTMPIKDSQSIRKVIRENTPGLDLNIPTTTPSGEEMKVRISLGVEFFRPFYGL